jgi:hypothetical protein
LSNITNKKILQITSQTTFEGNYQCWLYPNNYLKLIDTNIIPSYSFYCINNNYVYNDSDNILNISNAQLVDNDLFNRETKQLLKIYKTFVSTENFLVKQVKSNNINFDNINKLSFISNYTNELFDVKYYDSSAIDLLGNNEIVVSNVFNISGINLLLPMIINTYQNIKEIVIPNIKFTVNGIEYKKSVIPIYKNQSNQYMIGTINDTKEYISLSPNIQIISGTVNILDTSIYNVDKFYLIKLKEKTSDNIFYFWIIFFYSGDINFTNYLNLAPNYSEPLLLNKYNNLINTQNNFPVNFNGYSFLGCSPNILFGDNKNNLIYLLTEKTNNFVYKYYTDTRCNDIINTNYEIKTNNFNSILNIKPYYVYDNINYKNAEIIIVKKNNEINVYLQNEVYDTSNATVYFSLSPPVFIYNKITIYQKNDIYVISSYEKLFLEQNEIIILDNNYFIVEGLNVYNNYYELKLIKNNNQMRYNYNGYHTIGNYLKKNNKLIPDLDYQNIVTYHQTSNINIGELYKNNNLFDIFLPSDTQLAATLKSVIYKISKDINTNSELYNYISSVLTRKNNSTFMISDLKLLYTTTEIENYLSDIIIKKNVYVRNRKNFGNEDLLSIMSIDGVSIRNTKGEQESNLQFRVTYNQLTEYVVETANYFKTLKIDDYINNYYLATNMYSLYIKFNLSDLIYRYSLLSTPYLLVKLFPIEIINKASNIFALSLNITQTINNVCTFSETSLRIKLLYSDNKLFICDNFIKLKRLDNIIFNFNVVYTIINIIDSQVFLDRTLIIDNLLNNTFVDFILSYQPFEIEYVNFNNGVITNKTFDDNQTIIINNVLYPVINNKINNSIYGFTWIKLWKTNYESYFLNKFTVPNITNISNLTNNYPVEIQVAYNTCFTILNNQAYDLYYMQPVYIGGTYNYISNINNNTISLVNPVIYSSLSTLTLSPQYNYNYYSDIQIRYNFGLQIYDYDNLNEIIVYRFALLYDTLIFFEKVNFIYNVSISDNEIKNNITGDYTNIYFYNYKQLNDDGSISNYDILHNSYHLILEKFTDYEKIHLAKITYPNQIKVYTTISDIYYELLLGRIIPITINNNNFAYSSLKIKQSRHYPDINPKQVEIIKKYNIKFIGYPIITTNYKQQVNFINPIDIRIYNKVYINDKMYELVYENSKYYIISEDYLSNNIKQVYTKNINWLINATKKTKTLKNNELDKSIEYYLKSQVTDKEYITQNINVSKLNTSLYHYKLIDNSLNYEININNNNYNIYRVHQSIIESDVNSRVIKLVDPIDNDITEISQEYITVDLYIENKINTEYIFNPIDMFSDVKEFRTTLFFNSGIKNTDIYNYLKPWLTWSLLNSINKVSSLSELVNQGYISGTSFIHSTSYSYLTNNEITSLSNFMANTSNFSILKNIENNIFDNLNNWLLNPSFFFNVNENINNYLINFNVSFDGNNILKDNVPIPYITNEYEYIDNKVYRSKTSFSNINTEVGNWLYKNKPTNFGVSVIDLLKYLVTLGDEIQNLYNYLDTQLYSPYNIYDNPLKFVINKLAEKNQPELLNDNFNDTMVMKNSFDIVNSEYYTSINYLGNLTFAEQVNSLNTKTEFNTEYIETYEPNIIYPINKKMELKTDVIYPYIINFSTNEVIPDTFYTINLLNGITIASDINVDITNLYPNQLSFDSTYNLKTDEYMVIKQTSYYTVSSKLNLGYLYRISINNINTINIDEIYYQNQNILNTNKNNSNIDIYVNTNIVTTDLFEIRNMIGIVSVNNINNKQYLEFYNSSKVIYITDRTLLKTDTNLYLLNLDTNLNQYYILGTKLDTFDVSIVTMFNPDSIINLNQFSIQYELEPKYLDNNDNKNNYIFELKNSLTDDIVIPISINTLGNGQMIFSYNTSVSNILTDNNYNQVIQTKTLGQDITNQITSITSFPVYLYYFNFIIPSTSTTYAQIDNEVDNEKYFNQKDNRTYFSSSILHTDTLNLLFKQNNSWFITTFSSLSNNITLVLPNDFIMDVGTKFTYMYNNIELDKTQFVFYNGTLSFPYLGTSGTQLLEQIYTDIGLFTPDFNRKYSIIYNTPYQYNDKQFYIQPNNVPQYLYKLNTLYANTLYINNNINLYTNGYKISGVVFEAVISSYYIIAINEKINESLKYTYNLEDDITRGVNSIIYYQDSLQYGEFYKHEFNNSILLFMNDQVHDYVYNNNKYNLVSYFDYDVINKYYPNEFVQSTDMKRIDEYSYTTITTLEKPIWDSPAKLFSYIRLFFNDQLMEELNEDVCNLVYHIYITEEKRKQVRSLMRIRETEFGWELYFPLIFWFNNRAGLAIPTIALLHTELRLEYKLNEISYMLLNNLDKANFSKKPQIKITLLSDFILLDTMERKLFGSYSHEYIIEKFTHWGTNYVNKESITVSKKLTGLVKDIFIVTKPFNTNIYNYDKVYARYIKALGYYEKYIKLNVFESNEEKDYQIDIDIIRKNLIDYKLKRNINELINTFSKLPFFNTEFLLFLMYYQKKYNASMYSIMIYIKYMYKNEKIINEISPIKSMVLKVNGTELFSERDYTYYTNVIPYQKFNNSLPIGYYAYTFSLYPTDPQFSGHLNFTNLDDIVFGITSNKPGYNLNTVVKEYNILRIMSGIGSMAW